jgi:hypothetical protein
VPRLLLRLDGLLPHVLCVKAVLYGGVTRCVSTRRRRIVACACGCSPECLPLFTSCVPACVLLCACSPLYSTLLDLRFFSKPLSRREVWTASELVNVAGLTLLVYAALSY